LILKGSSTSQQIAKQIKVIGVSALGHERRPFKWRLLDDFRYARGSDRGRVAAQYVAKGQ
jgi:hypothetical protein